LTSGRSTSCGCIKDEICLQRHNEAIINKAHLKEEQDKNRPEEKIKPGNIYNYLKVISFAYVKNKHSYYNCQCLKCKRLTIIRGSYLINGHTKSCGCLKSIGEQIIINLLDNNGIKYEKEKTFDDCRYPDTNHLARFDFYVNDEYIIEYDGIQHFYQSDGWNT